MRGQTEGKMNTRRGYHRGGSRHEGCGKRRKGGRRTKTRTRTKAGKKRKKCRRRKEKKEDCKMRVNSRRQTLGLSRG